MATSKRSTKRPKQTTKRSRTTKAGHSDNRVVWAAVLIIAGLVGWFAYGQSASPVDAGTQLGSARIIPATAAIKPDSSIVLRGEAFNTSGKQMAVGSVYFTDWKVIGVSGGKGTISPDPKDPAGTVATLKATSQAGVLNVLAVAHHQGSKQNVSAQIAINKSAPAQKAEVAPQALSRIAISPIVGSVKPGGKREFYAEGFDEAGKRIEGVKFTWRVQGVGSAHGSVTPLKSKDANGAFATFWAGFSKGYVYLWATGEYNGKKISHPATVAIQ